MTLLISHPNVEKFLPRLGTMQLREGKARIFESFLRVGGISVPTNYAALTIIRNRRHSYGRGEVLSGGARDVFQGCSGTLKR